MARLGPRAIAATFASFPSNPRLAYALLEDHATTTTKIPTLAPRLDIYLEFDIQRYVSI